MTGRPRGAYSAWLLKCAAAGSRRRFGGGYWRVDVACALKWLATRIENLAWRIEKPWAARVMADYFGEGRP